MWSSHRRDPITSSVLSLFSKEWAPKNSVPSYTALTWRWVPRTQNSTAICNRCLSVWLLLSSSIPQKQQQSQEKQHIQTYNTSPSHIKHPPPPHQTPDEEEQKHWNLPLIPSSSNVEPTIPCLRLSSSNPSTADPFMDPLPVEALPLPRFLPLPADEIRCSFVNFLGLGFLNPALRIGGFWPCRWPKQVRSRWIWTSIWWLLRNRWGFDSRCPWTGRSSCTLSRKG